MFPCPWTGGLDDTLHTIINYACEQNIPFVFALNRKALGRSLNKAVPVSVVGIFSYDGAQVSWEEAPACQHCLWEGGSRDSMVCRQSPTEPHSLSGLCFSGLPWKEV